MASTYVSLNADNVMPDGGRIMSASHAATTTLRSKVAKNSARRAIVTLFCDSSVTGTWNVYAVDPVTGKADSLTTAISVTGGTVASYTFAGVADAVFCDYAPGAGTAGTTVIRALFGGPGMAG